jgi:hypothetical protein
MPTVGLWKIQKIFRNVCWSADMDPEMIRGEYIKLIKNKKIIFSEYQQHWLNYRELYRLYREAGSKEERREIKKRIVEEALKSYLNHGGKKYLTPAGKGK